MPITYTAWFTSEDLIENRCEKNNSFHLRERSIAFNVYHLHAGAVTQLVVTNVGCWHCSHVGKANLDYVFAFKQACAFLLILEMQSETFSQYFVA